jgi:broad specificity phosphatase PhoE
VKRGVVALAAVVAITIGIVVLLAGEPDTYAHLRQTVRQEIPGALGFELEPPPEDAKPQLTPLEVRTRYPADGGEVQVAFASVLDTLENRSIGPAWILFARGVCLRNAKGELVSDARGNDPNNLECTNATIWILAVDPETAEPLVALTAYDESGTWTADVAG